MNRVLMVASMGSMIAQFNMENIFLLQELGFKVEIACNLSDIDPMSEERRKKFLGTLEENQIVYHHIDFQRKIGDPSKNKKSYTQLDQLCKKTNYKFIHTHSPLASIISRLVAKKNKIPVIYTAHGFQFFKNGPKKDWLLYYPIEFFFSRITDSVITINKEDYAISKKMFFKNSYYVPGVGIDYAKFRGADNESGNLRKKLGFLEKDFLILSVGELSKRKNHATIMKAIAKLDISNVQYLICGVGDEEKNLKKLSKDLNIEEKVHFLGYRTNINEIMQISDIFAFPSRREGLGLAAIEAMASGLPIVTSNINGINDYSVDGITGFKYASDDVNGFAYGISHLQENPQLRAKISDNNKNKAKEFDKSYVRSIMEKVYIEYRE